MRVKLRTTMAGPDGVHQAGSTPNLPTEEAVRLIDAGFAEAVDPMPAPPAQQRAKAVKGPAETR